MAVGKKKKPINRRNTKETMYSEEQIERIKQRVNLAELAASYGYVIDGKTGYSRTSLRMGNHGRKIIVATDRKDGHGVFFYVDGSGGGSAIDFVMREEGSISGRLALSWNTG